MMARFDQQYLVAWYKYRWVIEFARYNYIYRWKKYLPEYYGKRCRLLVAGSKNSILIEFENGHQMVTSRYSIRHERDTPERVCPKTTI